ncbi:hypothetical protein M433DRAFT_305012 [Acidomyces richmondensis BFW]|nr:MAG: hypothetical protein FE78DRAFT_456045 [Acidomyces sp. 'richmondensis']KYG44424.1 hypothetical protein M433DRAFT_305012 [Acidomyces richmondensis BFW]
MISGSPFVPSVSPSPQLSCRQPRPRFRNFVENPIGRAYRAVQGGGSGRGAWWSTFHGHEGVKISCVHQFVAATSWMATRYARGFISGLYLAQRTPLPIECRAQQDRIFDLNESNRTLFQQEKELKSLVLRSYYLERQRSMRYWQEVKRQNTFHSTSRLSAFPRPLSSDTRLDPLCHA